MAPQSLDETSYCKLLAEIAPRVIETEEEYDRVLPIVEQLHFSKNNTPEETALYRLLVMLVEDYETKTCPIESKPHEILKHIIESSGTAQDDLKQIMGVSSGILSEILSGDRPIDQEKAKLLGAHFKVSPDLFL